MKHLSTAADNRRGTSPPNPSEKKILTRTFSTIKSCHREFVTIFHATEGNLADRKAVSLHPYCVCGLCEVKWRIKRPTLCNRVLLLRWKGKPFVKKMKNTRNLKKTDESIDYVGEFLGQARDGPAMVIAGSERPEMKLNEGQTFIASHFFGANVWK